MAIVSAICLYYMDDGYFNTIVAKTGAYYVSVIIAAVLFIIFAVFHYAKTRETLSHEADSTECLIYAFVTSYLISAILSTHIMQALSGENGWYAGVASYFCAIILLLVVKNLRPAPELSAIMFAAVSLPIFVIAVFHGSGIDLFSLHSELIPDEHYNYISTAGNINVFSGIASIMMPFLAVSYIYLNRKKVSVLFIISIVTASVSLVLTGSDSGYIGVLMSLAIVYIVMSWRRTPLILLNRISIMVCGGFSIGTLIQKYDSASFPAAKYFSFFMNKYYIDIIVLMVVVIIGIILRQKKDLVLDWRIMLVASVIVTLVIFSYFIEGIRENIRFGNSRVRIWERAVKVYRQGSLREKIFGVGADCFGDYTTGLTIGGRTVANCHNEFLQHLVCGGIVTAAIYIAIIVNIAVRALRSRKISPFFFGLCGYVLQAQLNNPHNLLIPFVSMFIALLTF